MGLYKQPNDWTCGPFALKHALVALGRLASEHEISHVAKPHWWAGTNEVKLAEAARAFDCNLPLVRRRDPVLAKRKLVEYLTHNIPVLLCVDNWGHWITAVRHDKSRFVIVDSLDDPVLRVVTWEQLKRRWQYQEEETLGDEDFPTVFDMHPVTPSFRVPIKANFSVARAQFLRRPTNRDLGAHWDDYLGDLLEICRPRSVRRTSFLSMAEFLRRHQAMLLNRVTYWHGEVQRKEVARVLRNMRFVADTYGLIIPEADRRRALTDIVVLLTMWATSVRPVGDMYGSLEGAHPLKRR